MVEADENCITQSLLINGAIGARDRSEPILERSRTGGFNMIRARSLVAGLLVVMWLGPRPFGVLGGQEGPGAKASEEEYEIYSSMIREMYVKPDSKLLMVEERTSRYDFSGGDDQPWRDKPKGLVIDQSAVEDYESKNRGQSVLNKGLFKLATKCELITDADLRAIFHGHWGELEWTEYYRRFPTSSGFIMLSRVGFNTEHTQALLYIGSRSGPGYGEIHFLFLEKAGGTWAIKKQLRKNKFG